MSEQDTLEVTLDLASMSPQAVEDAMRSGRSIVVGPESAPMPAPTPTDPMLALIERVLLDPRFDVAKLDQLLAVRTRYEATEQRKLFVAAMAAFKANPPQINKDKRVFYPGRDGKPATEFWHASLGSMAQAISRAMAAHQLAFRWDVQQDLKDGGRVTVSCILSHAAGHEERVTLSGSPDTTGSKNNLQAVGSTVRYLQRYTLETAAGLAAQDLEDDDGAGGAPAEAPPEVQALLDKIAACTTVPQLRELWHSLPSYEQHLVEAEKNERYKQLTMPKRKGAPDVQK